MPTAFLGTDLFQNAKGVSTMAITGRRFLELNRVEDLVVSNHAIARMEQTIGFKPTTALASIWFKQSRHLKGDAIFDWGYRPASSRHLEEGYRTWYFRFQVFGQECIAVISQRGGAGPLVWITTYAPNRQTMRFRQASGVMFAA